MKENKIRHLEMIQSVISRMGANSFSLKGWGVTLIAGIFVLSSKDSDKTYFLITYLPVIVFWVLDSFYLLLERKYTALYENVRLKDESEIDFDMKIDIVNIETKERDRLCFWKCLFSTTEAGFYLPCAAILTVLICLVK